MYELIKYVIADILKIFPKCIYNIDEQLFIYCLHCFGRVLFLAVSGLVLLRYQKDLSPYDLYRSANRFDS